MIAETQRELYRNRTEQFIKRLSKEILVESSHLKADYALTKEAVPFDEREKLEYSPIIEGAHWGSTWESAWFKIRGTVPKQWKGKRVVAQLDFNGEALIFNEEGLPLQGLTNGSIFERGYTRDIFPLYDKAEGNEEINLWIDAAAFSRFGVNRDQDPARNCPTRHGTYSGKVNKLRLATYDLELYHLWLDMKVLLELYQALNPDSTQGVRILRGLTKAIDAYGDNPMHASKSREIIRPLLEKKAHASAVTALAVGHAHIDTGWLWPVKETIRKCARTFANQLDLLEQYPGYVFGASQPAHYAMMKEHYPALYEKMREQIKEGRWELQGGMWVEADCNISSGESLVRQFIHGKNFFMDEFGFDVKNLWLPDVFGYSASMPQIMKKAGVDYFLSQKMCWSQFNRFPHTTFNWKGVDGSTVLTHFLPEEMNNYNSRLMPDGLIEGEKNFKEKEVLDEMLVTFGVGNGGGGAKPEHLERALRLRDLEGVPKVKFGRADEFFERVNSQAEELPSWVGELYLENHRGTFTTQGLTKRGNRKLEQSLRATEYLLSCDELCHYPQEKLDGIWKTLLLNQFHDIIPGSSIRKVYEVTEQDYRDGLSECERMKDDVAQRLFIKDENSMVIVNTLNIPVIETIILPDQWLGIKGVVSQVESDGRVRTTIDLPAQGIKTFERANESWPEKSKTVPSLILENELVRYEFSSNGEVLKAYDKEIDKEILSDVGNLFTLYEDRPVSNDAWNIDIYYEDQALETAQGLSHEGFGSGLVREGIKFELQIGESKISQKVSLGRGSKRLDFVTAVNWCERHRMLRVAFPTSVQSQVASFDIQYAYVQRNTHRNLSWDMARFEVAAHKFADISDNDYGVALLNDCKYGYKVLGSTLDLNLLRSPTHPDPDADIGDHEFTYSLLPHIGNMVNSKVQSEAIQLNQPPLQFYGYSEGRAKLPIIVEGDGVGLEVIKKAEKGDHLIVRLVERKGHETTARMKLSNQSASVIEIDLLEWNEIKDYGKGEAEVLMKPFDIRTFKVIC
jgi:alpha-mannosidase